MQYASLLEKLSAYLQLPAIVPDPAQRFGLYIDGVHVIFTPQWPQEDRLCLSVRAALGRSDGQDAMLSEKLLGANLAGRAMAGAWIGLEDSGFVTLNMFWAVHELGFERFCDLLNGFVSHAEYWTDALREHLHVAQGAPRGSGFDGMRA